MQTFGFSFLKWLSISDGNNNSNNQRTNGPVNAHLISGPCISTQHTNPK